MVLWPFAFSTKATEFRKPIWRGFSTSSTGSAAATASVPAPGLVLRSAVVSSRPWEAGLPPRTGPAGRRFLRSRFRHPPARDPAMTPWVGPLRILVVDDEPAILRFR